MRRFFQYLFLFFLAFSFFFLIAIIRPVWCDEIWVYGFSHNISEGMVIYRDFNALQMPLYIFISSFFLFVFGDYVISTHLFDCILIGLLFLMMYKKIGIKSIFILFILTIGYSGYNLLSLFLLMSILFFIDAGKYHDFLIGLLVGLIFITKQNIGIALFVPYIYYSKKKFRSIFYFFIPFLIISVYFILNSSYFSFLDCVFGSMFDFNQQNKKLFFSFLLIEFFVICHLLVLINKNRFYDKRLLYTMFFQVISYPICDDSHLFLALIPYFYILFSYPFDKKKFYFLLFFIFYSFYSLFLKPFNVSFENNSFYLRNLSTVKMQFLDDFSYFSKKYDHSYFIDWQAYVYKIYYRKPIDRFDFMLSGNCGYHGVRKLIKEVENSCQKETCLFVIYQDDFNSSISQWKEIIDYVKNHYSSIEIDDGFYLLGNEDYIHEKE